MCVHFKISQTRVDPEGVGAGWCRTLDGDSLVRNIICELLVMFVFAILRVASGLVSGP